MPVCMARLWWQAGVNVIVVAVIVTMRMLVFHGMVMMRMRVAFSKQKTNTYHQNDCSDRVHCRERLMEHDNGKHHSEKRGGREHDLRSRGADDVSGPDVQHDANAV